MKKKNKKDKTIKRATIKEPEPSKNPNNEQESETTAPTVYVKELEVLLLKLDFMERQCVQEKLDEEKLALKDDYIATKREIYKLLAETSDLIRSRYEMQMEHGNNVEVIQKGCTIKKQLETLDFKFNFATDIFRKQSKQQGKKYSAQQIDQRFEELQLMKQHISETKNLFENPNPFKNKDVQSLAAFKSVKFAEGKPKVTGEWKDLNEEEQSIINRWRDQDIEIDKQVEEVGDRIDRLGEIAIQIGQKAELQSKIVKSLNNQADTANKQLVELNSGLKTFLMQGGGFNLVCKIVLCTVIIGINGFNFTILTNRFLR